KHADVNADAPEFTATGGRRQRNWGFGGTPLHVATATGDQPLVELLLANKANVNAVNKNGQTPLHSAVSSGRAGIATVLLAAGANVNAKTLGSPNRDWTPLAFAIPQGHKDVVELLLKNRADPNVRFETSWNNPVEKNSTPLLLAVHHSKAEI